MEEALPFCCQGAADWTLSFREIVDVVGERPPPATGLEHARQHTLFIEHIDDRTLFLDDYDYRVMGLHAALVDGVSKTTGGLAGARLDSRAAHRYRR